MPLVRLESEAGEGLKQKYVHYFENILYLSAEVENVSLDTTSNRKKALDGKLERSAPSSSH